MKTAFRILFVFVCFGFMLSAILWAVWNDRADRRLSDHPAWRAAMMSDGPSASLARFAARPDGDGVEEDPDNAAYWMARLPSYEDTLALLADGLGVVYMYDWDWPTLPDSQYRQCAISYMEQVMDDPTLLTVEQRQRFCRLFETHRELADTLANMGDSSHFYYTIPESPDSYYWSQALLALTQKALFAASAVLGLEGESDRAAELWMIAVRATDHCLTGDDAVFYHSRRMRNLSDATVASAWVFSDPNLDRATVHAAMERMRTDQMIAQLRQFIEMARDHAIADAVLDLRSWRAGEVEYRCMCGGCISIWERALFRIMPIVGSPLLKEDMSLMVYQYDAYLHLLGGPSWEWDLDGLCAEIQGDGQDGMVNILLRPYSGSLSLWTAGETRDTMVPMDATRLAMAALLWRRDHDGRLPESLDALVPEYLDALPRDSRTGGPFTLRDLDGRLVVHSNRAEVADDHTRSLNRPNRPDDTIRWWAEPSPKSSVAEVLLPPTDQ